MSLNISNTQVGKNLNITLIASKNITYFEIILTKYVQYLYTEGYKNSAEKNFFKC